MLSVPHVKVAVVGAGPAGSSAANALMLAGASSVALIDRARFPRDKSCGDGLGVGVIGVLERLQLAHLLEGQKRIKRFAITFHDRIHVGFDLVNGFKKVVCALEGEVRRLNRDQEVGSRDHGRDGDQAQGRRRIDNDILELPCQCVQGVSQPEMGIQLARQGLLKLGHGDRGRCELQGLERRLDDRLLDG